MYNYLNSGYQAIHSMLHETMCITGLTARFSPFFDLVSVSFFIYYIGVGRGWGWGWWWWIGGLASHYFAKLNITIIYFCLSRFLITILSLVWWHRSATTSQINISTCQKIMSNCEIICHLLVIIISFKSTYM